METIISIAVIIFVLLVLLYVEKLMYRKALSVGEINAYQKVLNKMGNNLKDRWDIEWKQDAHAELKKQRREKKAALLVFSGIFLAFVLILLKLELNISPNNIAVFAGSSLILICYGFIKMAESRKLAISILSLIFILFVLAMFIFEKLMAISPYSYFYLCGVVVIMGVISLINKRK